MRRRAAYGAFALVVSGLMWRGFQVIAMRRHAVAMQPGGGHAGAQVAIVADGFMQALADGLSMLAGPCKRGLRGIGPGGGYGQHPVACPRISKRCSTCVVVRTTGAP